MNGAFGVVDAADVEIVRGNLVGILYEARAIFFFASPPLDYDHHDIGQQQELLEAAFAGQGWEIPRLLAAMRDSWPAVTRGGRRAKPALVPWISSARHRSRQATPPSLRPLRLVVAGSEAGLVVVIARPSRADGADVGRGGGAGVKIAAGALGVRMWSGLSLLVED